MNKSEKLRRFGLRTKIFGGNWYNSSSGFRALLIIMTSGSAMKTPQMNMSVNSSALPAIERLSLRAFLGIIFCRRSFFCSFGGKSLTAT